MNKSLILRKIQEYYNFKKDKDFATFLGIKQNSLSNWYTRETMDYDLIVEKCEEINGHWLLTGKGDMLKNKEEFYSNKINILEKENEFLISSNNSLKEINELLKNENMRLELENKILKK